MHLILRIFLKNSFLAYLFKFFMDWSPWMGEDPHPVFIRGACSVLLEPVLLPRRPPVPRHVEAVADGCRESGRRHAMGKGEGGVGRGAAFGRRRLGVGCGVKLGRRS
jgi:hypothetical protein